MQFNFAGERTLTQLDYVRLTRLLVQWPRQTAGAMGDVLESSELVASAAVEPTVVTMYSQVLLHDDAGGAPWKVTLCYPADAEPANGFISVMSPLGASLLGLRVGDEATWEVPDRGVHRARIAQLLFQPEASGDYTT